MVHDESSPQEGSLLGGDSPQISSSIHPRSLLNGFNDSLSLPIKIEIPTARFYTE